MNKKISVIIPVHNAIKEFQKCLRSIIKYFDFDSGEVIVIDDASDTEFSVPSCIKFMRNEKNEGYLKSCNKAVKFAGGEIVVLLNSDTEIYGNFCSEIIRCFDSDSNIIAASPIASNSANYWIPQIYPLSRMNKCISKNKPTYPRVFNAEGFCFCLRKSFADNYGLYDEIYSPGYGEEVDLCQRVKSRGGKCVLIDNLYVKHLRHRSFKENSKRLTSEHNKILYKRWAKFFNNEEYVPQRGRIMNNIIGKSFSPVSRFIIYRILRFYRFLRDSRILALKNISLHSVENKNRVIYTCITGSCDKFPIVQKYKDSSAYVCFTDNKFLIGLKRIGEWEIRPLVFNSLDNVRNARWHKTHPHILFPEYEESVWLDGNVEILTNKFFEEIKNREFAVPIHYCRDDIYEEIKSARMMHPELYSILKEQEQFLRTEGMKEGYGLNETNIIFRKHKKTSDIMDAWWDMINKYSSRDQTSLSYVLWKNNIRVNKISIDNARIDCLNYKIYSHN